MGGTTTAAPGPTAPERPLSPLGHAAALLGYLLIAIWLTWPAAAHLADRYYTGGEGIFFFPATPDAPQNIWNFWWTARAAGAGQSPFFTPLLYYPEGAQMALQTLNAVAVVLALPVTAALGPTAAYNATAIAAMALTGYAGFLLARRFAPGVAGPFLAGALLTGAPFHVAKLDSGQLNFVTMQWVVLFMLAMVALSRADGWGWAALAALAFAAVLYTDWYWALVAAFFGAAWAALSVVGAPRPLAILGRYALFGALAALSALPLALALRGGAAGQQGSNELWAAYTQGYSADALGLLFPAARHPLWAAPAERFLVAVAPFSITEGSYTAAGWTLVALAALGVAWFGRREWRLLLAALLGWLLAVGPTLHILGYATGLPMPYQLLQALPLLGTARRPNLFGAITIVACAVFAALALARLRERLPPRRYALALAAVAAVAVFELWPPARVANSLARPEVFERIAAEPGMVVDLPLETGTDSRTLIHQIVHGQPILRGYVARPPSYPTLAYSPLPAQLARGRLWPEDDIVALGPDALAAMQCYYRLRHLVVEAALLSPEQRDAALELAARLNGGPLPPWFDDGQFQAYRLPLYEDHCAPFVFLGAGWNSREGGPGAGWRWSEGRSELYVVNPGEAAAPLTLELRAEAREEGQQLEVWNGDELAARLNLSRAARHYRVPLWLPPGQTRLELRTAAVGDGARAIGVSVSAVAVR